MSTQPAPSDPVWTLSRVAVAAHRPAVLDALDTGAPHALTRDDVHALGIAYRSTAETIAALRGDGGGWLVDDDGHTTWVAGPDEAAITDAQIHQLRDEAAAAGDHAQIALCLAALGQPAYRVVAILPDGQTCDDEGHVGQAAGVPYETRDEAEREVEYLDDDRPEGHEAVRYEVRQLQMDRAAARAACARVIADARAAQAEDAR